jgi:thiol-disulfide isomerase/thioredoxin
MRIVELARRSFIYLALAALTVLAVVEARAGAGLRPPREPGLSAPAFALPDVEGRSLSLGSLRGRPVLLNFWATWCPPCLAELPALEALAQAHPDCLQVVGIAESSGGADQIAAFARERRLTLSAAPRRWARRCKLFGRDPSSLGADRFRRRHRRDLRGRGDEVGPGEGGARDRSGHPALLMLRRAAGAGMGIYDVVVYLCATALRRVARL